MLNWWLGRPAEDATRDEADDHEPPETPAPVFAARAFKSAIFGTPAHHDENGLETPQQAADMNVRNRAGAQRSGAASPTKPQGILLTPGTATARRKTVSFGVGVVDKEEKSLTDKSGVPNNCPGKFPSPWTPKVDENQHTTRRTSLTKTLEAARDSKSKKSGPGKNPASATTKPSPDTDPSVGGATKSSKDVTAPDIIQSGVSEANATASRIDDFDGDVTIDLNEPHSQSGRYWKSEYERYHEEAKAEMRKLIKYKQLAKSYAKKKDAEAINLGERLREEQQKVTNMEAKISELVSQIAGRRLSGTEDDTPDLIKDLARQTVLAMEYRDQVDQFEAALHEGDAQRDQQSSRSDQKAASPRTARTIIETGQELKRAREQLAEMGSLRDEIHNLRLNFSMVEKKASRLQEENAKFVRDLAHMTDELEKSERRRLSAETQSHEQTRLLQGLQKDYDTLKELAKSQRRDAEDLLRKRHDQVAKLKKEIRSLKEKSETPNPEVINQFTSHKTGEVGVHSGEEVAEVVKSKSVTHVGDLISFDMSPPKAERRRSGLHRKLDIGPSDPRARESGELPPRSFISTSHNHQERTKPDCRDDNHLLDSKIPIIDRSTKKFESPHQGARKVVDPQRSNGVASKETALTEIINHAVADNSPARNGGLPASQLSGSFNERFSSFTLNSPSPALPSSDLAFAHSSSRRIQDKRSTDSSRPSTFNIPSSPPKQALPRPRSSGTDANNYSNGNAVPSRLSSVSSRARIALPSDRAAAAKARLEQKSAEKKRAQELAEQKENIKD